MNILVAKLALILVAAGLAEVIAIFPVVALPMILGCFIAWCGIQIMEQR